MHSSSLIYLILVSAIATAHAWVTPAIQSHTICRIHDRQQQPRHAKTVDDDDDGATTIVQRTFYRFSHGSDVDVHNSMVLEDRSTVGDSSSSKGHGTILLRDGNVEEGEIGDAFYSISPETTLSTSEIAMALYLASNPTLCTEDMLEVSSETGLASILGCVGAGFVLKRNSNAPASLLQDDVADDILTISSSSHSDKLLPPTLEKLTLTAPDERHLDVLLRNSKHSGIASSKLSVEPLDWKMRNVRNTRVVPSEVTTLVAVDLALTFPEAVLLARTCAYRLRPSWVGRTVTQVVPTLVHMCPADREDAAYLQRELTTNYKMSAFTGYLKLEKLIFCPQTVPHTADMATTLEDMELEVQEERSLAFSSLVAQHHPDYVGGGSGELFFPADTGATGFREAESW